MKVISNSKFLVAGFCIGLLPPLEAWIVDIVLSGLPFSFNSILVIHENNFLHYFIDTTPFFVALTFSVWGRLQGQLNENMRMLNQALKLEAVGQLTGGIAHDFNNILSIIDGNIHFLKEDLGTVDPEIEELFDDALSATKDGVELTRRLLSFSHKGSLVPRVIEVNETVHNFMRFVARTIPEKIDLKIQLHDEKLYINVDVSQFESALLNFCLNARDALPKGGEVTIRVSKLTRDSSQNSRLAIENGEYVAISVEDNGVGIPSEILERAFEPFFTTKELGKGTGLGLSMVYGFTKQSEGTCEIQSKVNQGTTATMYFPQAEPDGNQLVEKQKMKEKSGEEGQGIILVVEDEPRVRRVALRELNKQGYKTLEAENAIIAQSIIESGEKIDVLFSDILMPGGMDGYKLGAWTVENYPDIRVILTSGYSKDKIGDDGADKYGFPLLKKPYSFERLSEEIKKALGG